MRHAHFNQSQRIFSIITYKVGLVDQSTDLNLYILMNEFHFSPMPYVSATLHHRMTLYCICVRVPRECPSKHSPIVLLDKLAGNTTFSGHVGLSVCSHMSIATIRMLSAYIVCVRVFFFFNSL